MHKELFAKEHENTPLSSGLQIPNSKLNIFDERKIDNKSFVWSTTKKSDELFLNSSKKRKFNIGSSTNENIPKEDNLQRMGEQSRSATHVGSVIPQYVAKQKQINSLVKDIVNSIQICNQELLLLQDEKITQVIQQFETEFQSYIVQINK